MQTSESIGALAAALAKAQAEMKGAVKDSTNPHFRSKYADLSSIREAAVGPLAKHGIAVVQGVEAEGPVVRVSTTLVHESGEWMRSTLTMTSLQDTPQGIGSTITYGRKYGLASMTSVAPEDDDGNEASRPAPQREAPRPPPKPTVPPDAINRKSAVMDYMEKRYGLQSMRSMMAQILGKTFPVTEEIHVTLTELQKLENFIQGLEQEPGAAG